MSNASLYVHGKAEPVDTLIESIQFMHSVGAEAPEVNWYRKNESKGKAFVNLDFSDISQADRMAQVINGMDPNMHAELTNENGDPVPIADLHQARLSRGVMIHLPDGPEYLQNTLIGGPHGRGKTQTLLRAMVNVAANPQAILVVNTYGGVEDWREFNPNQLLADRDASSALSWALGQMKQRQSQLDAADGDHSFKPIVLALDDPELEEDSSEMLLRVLSQGRAAGVYVYLTMTTSKHEVASVQLPARLGANFSRFIELKPRGTDE